MPQPVPDHSHPRVLIVDDEPLARDCIRLALATRSDVVVVGECGDGPQAVQAIQELAPDIVFLDVQMPELDGFGVIAEVGPDQMPPVVFVTAFDAHALRAFEVHALDYVLKPFDDERLLAAFDHARLRWLEQRHGALGRQLTELVRGWEGNEGPSELPRGRRATPEGNVATEAPTATERKSGYVTRFTVRNEGAAHFIPALAVDWIEAEGNYIVLRVGEAKHRVRGTLRDVGAKLDPRLFVRIHRSAIVNIERIRELQPWFGGDYVAILKNGAKLKVSRRHVAQLLRPMA
ncbi:MAG: response regulator transcription factor [Cytophagaceae bacterium]|nr:response regulator transcription factor [Gemmatimonadaceae bacterium]